MLRALTKHEGRSPGKFHVETVALDAQILRKRRRPLCPEIDWKSETRRLEVFVKFIQLRSLGILKTKTQQETLKSNKN